MSAFGTATAAKLSDTLKAMRRVITGVDAAGRAVITHEGRAPGQHENAKIPGRGWTDFWVWRETPQPLGGSEDAGLWPDEFPAPVHGGHLRCVHWLDKRDGAPPLGAPHAPIKVEGSRSWDRGGGNNHYVSDMHKTESLDFGVVLEGERIMVCDEGRATIVPGDVVVDVGAWHLWDSTKHGCHMAFDMFDAAFGPGDGTHGTVEEDRPVMQPPAGFKLPDGIKPQRRVVAIDSKPGHSKIVSDGPSPDVRLDPARPGFALHRMWVAERHPAPMVTETLHLPEVIVPPKDGAVLYTLTVPPDGSSNADVAAAKAWYDSIGAGAVATCGSIAGHPYSHRSDTVDFLMVTAGEIVLVLDSGDEAVLKAGEIGVVRGGNHAIANRSGAPAVVTIASHAAKR